jgi:maltose-binding protein MalE
MIDTVSSMQIRPPDPAYRNLIGIVQNATGIVATGEATPDEAVQRYAEELTNVLGAESVVAQPCP